MKLSYKMTLIVSFMFFFAISGVLSFANLNTSDESLFSDELEYENYSTQETLENWYDGIETFYDDLVGSAPSYWIISGTVDIASSYSSHTQVLRQQTTETAEYFFSGANSTDRYKELNFNVYWYKCLDWSEYGYLKLETNNSHTFEIYRYDHTQPEYDRIDYYYRVDGGGWTVFYQTFTSYVQVWNRFNFRTYRESGNVKLDLYWDYTDITEASITWFTDEDFTFDTFTVWSSSGQANSYIDALNVYFNDSTQVGTYVSQISNEITHEDTNSDPYGADDYFNQRSSLMDVYPDSANNYRTYLISDKIITDNYIEQNRLLRLEGTETEQRKYKVLQFYFDDLNETGAFTYPYSETGIEGKSSYTEIDGAVKQTSSNDLDASDGVLLNYSSSYSGTYSTNLVVFNDNLSLHTINDFPDSTNDGAGTMTYTDYVEELPNEYIHVVASHTDDYGLSFDSRNLRTYDANTNFPCESCYINFDNMEYGNISHDLAYENIGTERFGYGFYEDGTQATWNEVLVGNWNSGIWGQLSGIIPFSSNHDRWFRFVYSFDCRDGITDNSGWEGLNSDQHILRIYDYEADEWYTTTARDNNNDVDHLNSLHFTGSAGSYKHDNYYHDIKGITSVDNHYLEKLNFTVESNVIPYDVDQYKDYRLEMGYISNISDQQINISMYNYDNSEYDWINTSDMFDDWNNLTYEIDDIFPYLSPEDKIKLRFNGTNSDDWFSFDIDYLYVNYSFKEAETLNQSIRARIDSFDSSDLLINKFYVNIDFNQTAGIITWNAEYRESASVPRWHNTPTNPIFNFADHMPEGTLLQQLQINIHVFLTHDSNQKYLYIRTDVVINDHYSMAYQYDKIIDAGDSSFYDTQSRILVRYIDYFNYNNYTEIIESQYTEDFEQKYVYNNMRGYRLLQLNSTDWKYNFLDAGYFKTDLDYYVPPEVPDDEKEDVPDSPRAPKGAHFWKFDSYTLESTSTVNIYFEEDVDFYNDSVNVVFDVDFNTLSAKRDEYRYPYDDETISKSDMGGSWGIWNFVRDAIRFIVNSVLLLVQWFFYLITWAFHSGVLYLLYAIIIPFLYNTILYYIYYGFLLIVFYIYCGLIYILGWLWFFLIWLWDFLITVVLPFVFQIILIALAGIIAFGLWLLSGGTADYEELFNQTYNMLSVIADFFIESVIYFVENIVFFLLFVLLYTMLTFLYIPKVVYCKSRGYVNRSEQLDRAFQVFILPYKFAWTVIVKLKEMVVWW